MIEDLGFQPNASARALANGRTSTLALVFSSSPARGHYADMQLGFIGSVVEAAAEQEYDVLVSAGSPAGAEGLARMAGERRVQVAREVVERDVHDRGVEDDCDASGHDRQRCADDLRVELVRAVAGRRRHGLASGHSHSFYLDRDPNKTH
ncbi:hypothetical protein [Streptomyces sp. NBC_00063]|uniref:hypothetical protein n=1 Tax=Streptomyces sp. NBC_00063 TaxID=2975638 RepID=UPI003D7066AD